MVGHPLPQDVVMQKSEQDRAEVAVSGVQEPGRWPGSPETSDAGNVDEYPSTVNANQRHSWTLPGGQDLRLETWRLET